MLRERGVFVEKRLGINITEALYKNAHGNSLWPKNDVQHENAPSSSNINNVNNCKNHRQDRSDRNKDESAEIDMVVSTKGVHDQTTQKLTIDNLSNTPKMYKTYYNYEDCYAGSANNNFDRKYIMFKNRWNQLKLKEDEQPEAFSIMLTGFAEVFYYDDPHGRNSSLKEMSFLFKSRFEIPERTRALVRGWESLTLQTILSTDPLNKLIDWLEIMISRLNDVRSWLPPDYQGAVIYQNKLLNAVRDIDTCKLAYQKPAKTVQGVIANLHASLATEMRTSILQLSKTSSTPVDSSIHYVDRKFVRSFKLPGDKLKGKNLSRLQETRLLADESLD